MPYDPAPTTAPETDDDSPGLTAWRAIPFERWYREVAEANPHRCQHRGPCGQRLLCDREEHRVGGHPTVELLDNGNVAFHCEGLTLTPNDPEYNERRAGLTLRAVG